MNLQKIKEKQTVLKAKEERQITIKKGKKGDSLAVHRLGCCPYTGLVPGREVRIYNICSSKKAARLQGFPGSSDAKNLPAMQ